MRIEMNRERVNEVLGTLYRRFLAKEFPFNLRDAQPPQIPENMPRNGFATKRDHACFLLLVCLYMRGQIKSHTAVRGFSRIYEKHPELFDPAVASQEDPAFIESVLVLHGLGFSSTQNGRFWVENMRRLHGSWGGDPRNIFKDVGSYEELCGRICNAKTRRKRVTASGHQGFLGFQKKMTSMVIYFFVDAGLIPAVRFPKPVDFHVMRIFLGNELTTVTGRANGNLVTDELMDKIREISLEFSKDYGVDPLHMSEFVWLFSRTLCAKHPGNISTYIGERTKPGVILRAKTVTWAKGQRRTYNLTCGQCPIESTCVYCIPAAPYYRNGKIILRARRDKPPQKNLFPPFKEVGQEKRNWRKSPKSTEDKQPETLQTKLFPS